MKDFEKHLDWFRESLFDDSITRLINSSDSRLDYAAGYFHDYPKIVELLDILRNGVKVDIPF